MLSKHLVKHKPDNEFLKAAINVKKTLAIPLLLFIIGFLIAFLIYPPAIIILCLLTVLITVKNDIKN